MSYAKAVAKSVFAVDSSKRRGWSAVRRAGVVLVSMIAMSALFGPEIGALASVAALYVGLQDRAADPPGYTVRIMVLQSLLLTAVVLAAGLAGSAWVTSLILVTLAGFSGLTARRDKAISRMFADLIAVLAFLGLNAVSLDYALEAGFAVLVASLLQAVATRAAVRFAADLPERRPVAAALLAVANHLDDAQQRALRGTGEAAAEAIRRADESVAHSDLSHDRRRALRKLIGDAEMIREEASALRARRAFDATPIADAEVQEAIANASDALRAAAAALSLDDTTAGVLSRRASAIEQLRESHRRASAILADKAAHGSARTLATATRRLIRHLRTLRDSPVARSGDRQERLRSGLRQDLGAPKPVDVRAALRLALAAALGLLAAHLLGLSHGGWIAATTVALLRPDHRALTSDTVARSIGTGVGALLVIPLVYVLPNVPAADIAMVAVLSFATYSVTSANEGLYIIAITVQTVFTRAVVGEDPTGVAIERVTDVLIGCAIAVALLLILPLRHGRRLRREVSAYADASATWIEALADGTKGKARTKQIRKYHRTMVGTRAVVQHGIDVRQLEPLGPGLRPWLAHNLYTLIHDATRACGAAEFPTQTEDGSSQPTSDQVRRSARFTAANLRGVAALLRDPTSDVTVPHPVFIAVLAAPTGGQSDSGADAESAADPDDTAYLLGIAERESAAALALVRQQPTKRAR